jgi:acyl transferase domain-containing protein
VHGNSSLGSGQNDGGKQKTANPKVRRLGGVINIQLFDSSFFLPGPEEVFLFYRA